MFKLQEGRRTRIPSLVDQALFVSGYRADSLCTEKVMGSGLRNNFVYYFGEKSSAYSIRMDRYRVLSLLYEEEDDSQESGITNAAAGSIAPATINLI